MPIFHFDSNVTSVHGSQTWEIEADTKEDALAAFANGEGEIVSEEIEVTAFDKPTIDDLYEVEESHINREGT